MKRWILPALFVCTLGGAITLAAFSGREGAPVQVLETKGKIPWQTSFEEGLQNAKQQKKPALLVFESKGCTYCKEMEKTTWRDSRVQDQTRGWIPVKVNGDQRTDLLAAYGVKGFPTAILVAGDGKPFAGAEGYISPTEFVSFLENSRSKWKG